MLNVGIILGSTRPNRNGEAVAKWVLEKTSGRGDARYELVDIKDYELPLLDEPIFVTPEYNHSTSGALKNAIDFLYAEWNNKAAGFVGYGSAGGARAVEHLRGVMAELQIADVRAQVLFSLITDFKDYSEFTPAVHHEPALDAMVA